MDYTNHDTNQYATVSDKSPTPLLKEIPYIKSAVGTLLSTDVI